ncbi:hypothetical protein CQA09_28640, partial [Klebsiella pneumoniae]
TLISDELPALSAEWRVKPSEKLAGLLWDSFYSPCARRDETAGPACWRPNQDIYLRENTLISDELPALSAEWRVKPSEKLAGLLWDSFYSP